MLYMNSIKKYLLQFQKELIRVRSESKLLGSLNDVASCLSTEEDCDKFRRAEQTFLEKKYTLALQLYLESRVTANTPFFCYRCAAFLAYRLGKKEEALSYCREALNVFPMDILALLLMKDLLPEEKAEQVARKIHRLMKTLDVENPLNEGMQNVVATSAAELDGIFQEQPQIELFCRI